MDFQYGPRVGPGSYFRNPIIPLFIRFCILKDSYSYYLRFAKTNNNVQFSGLAGHEVAIYIGTSSPAEALGAHL